MREIANISPVDIKKIEELQKKYQRKLEYLFKNPKFFKQVELIREEFGIYAYGIKSFIGVGDKVFESEKKRNYKKHVLISSLYYNNKELREMRLKVKSKKVVFQKRITKILEDFDLPINFVSGMSSYILYNHKSLSSFSHLSRCGIVVCEDNGKKRVFLEVFGNTKRNDIIKKNVWSELKKAIKKYSHKGEHLFRYSDFYFHQLLIDESLPVDGKGDDIKDDERFNEMGPAEKNIYKKRYREYQKNKNNSK